MKNEAPEFIKADVLCKNHLYTIKQEIVKAINLRLKDLDKSHERFKMEREEELMKFKIFILELEYKEGSWEDLV